MPLPASHKKEVKEVTIKDESSRQSGRVSKPAVHRAHIGQPVRVDKYQVLLGGTQHLTAEHLDDADVLLALTESKLEFGRWYHKPKGRGGSYIEMPPLEVSVEYNILAAPLTDFGGVPDNWGEFLKAEVIPLVKSGRKVLAFCQGSHGRTGTLLASLIALMEPKCKDPIAAARFRHCPQCVETVTQATAVFALRGLPLPHQWRGTDKFRGYVSR